MAKECLPGFLLSISLISDRITGSEFVSNHLDSVFGCSEDAGCEATNFVINVIRDDVLLGDSGFAIFINERV